MDKFYDRVSDIFVNMDEKKSVGIPVIILILAIVVILSAYLLTGYPIKLGMDFVGGVQYTGNTELSELQIRELFSDYPLQDVRSSGDRYIILFEFVDKETSDGLKRLIQQNFTNVEEKTIAPTYSKSLQQTALKALAISFLGVALVIFLLFKKIIPSITVIAAIFSDIVITIAFMNILNIELTMGTLAAILMLIGYSADSNVLLNDRVFKRSGELNEKIKEACGIGLTMTTTTLGALVVMYIVATYLNYIVPIVPTIPLLTQISSVLIIGLLADIMNTWMFNAGVLKTYVGSFTRSRKFGRRFL